MAADPITGAEDLITAAITRIWPEKGEAEKQQLAAILAQVQGQLAANTAEAATPGMHFRDGAGWTCVAGFAVQTLKPLIEWGATLVGHPLTLPSVDTATSTTMLFALLGLGSMHVYGQVKGI